MKWVFCKFGISTTVKTNQMAGHDPVRFTEDIRILTGYSLWLARCIKELENIYHQQLKTMTIIFHTYVVDFKRFVSFNCRHLDVCAASVDSKKKNLSGKVHPMYSRTKRWYFQRLFRHILLLRTEKAWKVKLSMVTCRWKV